MLPVGFAFSAVFIYSLILRNISDIYLEGNQEMTIDNSLIFDSEQRDDMRRLWAAMDDMPHPPACENYPDAYFHDDDNTRENEHIAKSLCRGCPIAMQCLAFAVKYNEVGIWGGTTEGGRRRLVRAYRRAQANVA